MQEVKLKQGKDKEMQFQITLNIQMYEETKSEVEIIFDRLLKQNAHLFRNIGKLCIKEIGPNQRHLLSGYIVRGKWGEV